MFCWVCSLLPSVDLTMFLLWKGIRAHSFYDLRQGSSSFWLMIQFHWKPSILSEEILAETNCAVLLATVLLALMNLKISKLSKLATPCSKDPRIASFQNPESHSKHKCMSVIWANSSTQSTCTLSSALFNGADFFMPGYFKEASNKTSINFYGRNS